MGLRRTVYESNSVCERIERNRKKTTNSIWLVPNDRSTLLHNLSSKSRFIWSDFLIRRTYTRFPGDRHKVSWGLLCLRVSFGKAHIVYLIPHNSVSLHIYLPSLNHFCFKPSHLFVVFTRVSSDILFANK